VIYATKAWPLLCLLLTALIPGAPRQRNPTIVVDCQRMQETRSESALRWEMLRQLR
jgi:hypothetical protein